MADQRAGEARRSARHAAVSRVSRTGRGDGYGGAATRRRAHRRLESAPCASRDDYHHRSGNRYLDDFHPLVRLLLHEDHRRMTKSTDFSPATRAVALPQDSGCGFASYHFA